MIKYITEGACAYLPKLVRMEVVRLLWQHVTRKEIFGLKPNSSLFGEDKEFCGSSNGFQMADEQIKVRVKKQRLIWTDDLH